MQIRAANPTKPRSYKDVGRAQIGARLSHVFNSDVPTSVVPGGSHQLHLGEPDQPTAKRLGALEPLSAVTAATDHLAASTVMQ